VIQVGLRPRGEALPAVALLAHGTPARRLAEKLLAVAEPGRWQGVAGRELLVVLGDDLPWCDGVRYLGREPEAPSLLLPTTARFSVAPALVERHLLAKGERAPIVVCDAPAVIVSLAGARPIAHRRLSEWLAA
jgi:MoxR-vWA-beta-propeller ternary system domain bpX5